MAERKKHKAVEKTPYGLLDYYSQKDGLLRTNLYPGEDQYFKNNPLTGGMASETGHVILNPYSPPNVDKESVFLNELARLYMRGQLQGTQPMRPAFNLTGEQYHGLPDSYKFAPVQDQRETIAARQFSADQSGGTQTGDQKAYVDAMKLILSGYKAPF
jgi:hypothetical protein